MVAQVFSPHKSYSMFVAPLISPSFGRGMNAVGSGANWNVGDCCKWYTRASVVIPYISSSTLLTNNESNDVVPVSIVDGIT